MCPSGPPTAMAALLYLLTAHATSLVLRRFARVRTATLAALVLLPLLLTGRELATRRIFAALDLAFTSEPLVSIADRAGVTEVSAPIASDVYAQFVPWQEAVRYALAHHQWPLWNPFEFCGDVLAPAVQSAPYHPLNVIGLLLPLADALTFTAAMLLFIAATSMYLFVRRLVDSELAALVGAVAWMFAPHVARFAGTAYALSLATMPLVLLGARRVARGPSLRSAAVLTFALVLTILAGHPESTLHIVIVATAYFFVELREWRRSVPLAIASGVSALLLTAIAVVPFVDAMTQTEEFRRRVNGGVHLANAPGHALRLAFDALLPGGAAYLGSVALLLAIVALVRRRGRDPMFFSVVFLVGLLAGVKAPLLTPLLTHLPLFSLAANEHLIWSAAFALAVLAAIGFDALELRTAIIAAAVIALVMLAGGAASVPDAGATAFRVVTPLLLVVAALLIRTPRYAAAAIVAVLLIQRGGETTSFRSSVPRRAFYPDFPGVEMLRADEPFRVIGQESILTPNIATHYGFEDPRGYQAMTLARYADISAAWSTPRAVWSNRVVKLDSPLLSLMNVRFALTVPREELPPGWNRLAIFNGYDIAENTRVLPRAFVPARIHSGVSRAEALDYTRGWPDFAGDAWIESGALGVAPNGPGTVSTRRVGTRLDMTASMQNAGWVVVSESAWRGWRAYVDHVRVPVVNADGAFIAFHVPAGQHHIRLVFRPTSFVIGAVISAIAVLFAGAGLVMASRSGMR
jgi:hypothetical protein